MDVSCLLITLLDYEDIITETNETTFKEFKRTKNASQQIWEIVGRIRIEKLKIDVYVSVQKKPDRDTHHLMITQKKLNKLLDEFANMHRARNFKSVEKFVLEAHQVLYKSLAKNMSKRFIEAYLHPISGKFNSIVTY